MSDVRFVLSVVTTAANQSPKTRSDELQNRYSSPTYVRTRRCKNAKIVMTQASYKVTLAVQAARNTLYYTLAIQEIKSPKFSFLKSSLPV